MKLTPAILSSWNPEKPLSELIFAKCNNKQITHVDDISSCVSLHKLDLSNNEIKKTGALSGLRYCSELTWLNLQNNQLDVCPPFDYQDKDGLGKMDKLLVLNLNLNQVERITPYLYKLKELKALILGHNKISKIENLESLINLNTLVLSYNKIEEVSNLTCLKSLTKLSIAHNKIRVFPDLRMNTELKELRLNNNRLLGVPEYVKFLPKLEILDLGNNFLKEFSDIENLKSLFHLNNLNLKGNPVTKLENYKEKVFFGFYFKIIYI
ncbi:L domain-like protein [Piromyces finnis]|uniref:L domain-like protein n=1 Tax=Piromyces finnis TaxID=1754191 RepID=A0A1Y1VCH5_9FUNG|nr:L domain-like protein [Piromyces finnis]|eukprot:ORX52576.1 L domain-like protein [Piromyces finnis]